MVRQINKNTHFYVRVYSINCVSNCPYTQGFEMPIVGTHKLVSRIEELSTADTTTIYILLKAFAMVMEADLHKHS